MSQYLQFRSWLERSSGAEKAVAGTAVAVALSLTALAAIPTTSAGGGGQDTLAADQGAVLQEQRAGAVGGPGAPGTPLDSAGGDSGLTGTTGTTGGSGTAGGAGPGTTGTTGSTGTTTPTGGPGTTTGTGTAAGPKGAACAVRTDVGVTATTVKLAVVLLNLGGAIGNGAVGVASPEEQRRAADGLIAEINATGGLKCRKIQPTYMEANPIDPPSSQRACLRIAEGGFWGVVDMGGFSYPPGVATCPAAKKIPIVTNSGLLPSESRQHGPYFMSISMDLVAAARTSMLGMKKLGYFDPAKGFKKLGIYEDDCSPEVNNGVYNALAAAGIAKKDISIYTFSCPGGGFAPANEASQAVVKHQGDGVTHVIPVTGGGSFKPYSEFAQRQGYKPKYTILDYNNMQGTATGATGPDRENFDGTVAVTSQKVGMKADSFDAPTKECAAVFKRRGVPVEWITNSYNAGSYCALFLTVKKAIDTAPGLRRTDIAAGLVALKSVAMAAPIQDAEFSSTDFAGGDYWWAIKYSASCNCWTPINRNRNPRL